MPAECQSCVRAEKLGSETDLVDHNVSRDIVVCGKLCQSQMTLLVWLFDRRLSSHREVMREASGGMRRVVELRKSKCSRPKSSHVRSRGVGSIRGKFGRVSEKGENIRKIIR